MHVQRSIFQLTIKSNLVLISLVYIVHWVINHWQLCWWCIIDWGIIGLLEDSIVTNDLSLIVPTHLLYQYPYSSRMVSDRCHVDIRGRTNNSHTTHTTLLSGKTSIIEGVTNSPCFMFTWEKNWQPSGTLLPLSCPRKTSYYLFCVQWDLTYHTIKHRQHQRNHPRKTFWKWQNYF